MLDATPPRADPGRVAARPSAVADLALDELLSGVDELARRWAIALIKARPLTRLAEIQLEQFAQRAPCLCEMVLRALASDVELDRLRAPEPTDERPAPATQLRRLLGTGDAAATVDAVEALRGVCWDALAQALRSPIAERSPERLVERLADRLAHVCAALLAASFAAEATVVDHNATTGGAAAQGAARSPIARELDRSARGARVVLIDERGETEEPRTRSDGGGDARARPLPWDTPLRVRRTAPPT